MTRTAAFLATLLVVGNAFAEAPPPEDEDAKGKFNAGARARFPSGPDETGAYKSFNWIAVDVVGRYNVSDFVRTSLNVPFAVKKPDIEGLSTFGGFTGRGELGLGKIVGVGLTLGAMRDRAFLLSEKDYPLYTGPLTAGAALGPYLRLNVFDAVLVSLIPQVVLQYGSGVAVQIPVSAKVRIGDLLQVGADAGVFTGEKLKMSAEGGGRIYAGAAAQLKLGPILLLTGAGVASLITGPGGFYPSIKESIYFDFNVRYAN